MDSTFFRTAKRRNRAVEVTDNEAIIPAVKDKPELRVPLPNRRELTFKERQVILDDHKDKIATLEETIEVERRSLLALVKAFREGGSTADVVVQNLKIKELMEQRSALANPDVWIEEIDGITLKEIFESKRDVRKIADGSTLFQVKRRSEPIQNLYVDLGKSAQDAANAAAEEESAEATAAAAAEAAAKATKLAKTIKQSETAASLTAAEGAIIGQRKSFKVKNPSGLAPVP